MDGNVDEALGILTRAPTPDAMRGEEALGCLSSGVGRWRAPRLPVESPGGSDGLL